MLIISKLAAVISNKFKKKKGTAAMKNIKEKFLKNLREITSALDQTTDRSKELTLLMTLYFMGETSINSSPITTKQKNRLYNLLSELKEDMCLDDIYCFYERASLKIIEPILKEFQSLSTVSKEYRKSLILSIDDTSLEVFGKNMQGAKKLHNGKKYFNGYHIVFIGLSLGKDFRIPISFRIYRPDTGETRIHLAAEMLDEIIPVLIRNPRIIAFDSLYLSEELIDMIMKHRLTWISKLKKNRIVRVSGNDYEKLTGQLLLFKDKFYYKLPFQVKVCIEKMKGLGIKTVHVFKRGIGEFVITYNEENSIIVCSDKKLRQKRIVWFYKLRWVIEEVFRIMKQCIAFTKVYYRSIKGQALIHGIKMLATVFLLLLRYQSRKMKNMTYKTMQNKLKDMFAKSSKYSQSQYAIIMKYKLT